ncbi:MAG: transglutaminase-like domain-containing protein [Acidimicrobiales bacterium]
MNRSTGLGELFARGDEVGVGEVAAHIAQLDDDAPPVPDILASFDDLVDDEVSTISQLMTHVFGTLGFRGNTEAYYKSNSYLHRVLDSRLGIPISLSVVAIEIGARCGLAIEPIGMPAHLLLGAGTGDNRRWFDPMAGAT